EPRDSPTLITGYTMRPCDLAFGLELVVNQLADPMLELHESRIALAPRSREIDRDFGFHAARAPREHDHPVGEKNRLLDAVGHQHHRLAQVGVPAREEPSHLLL